MTRRQQQGFTLVELAIVLAIIGLLITGLLKGKQLMDNARITTTIAQIQGIEAAVTTFRDAYGFIPGDVPAPAQRIPNWNAASAFSAVAGAATPGNGIIGNAAFGWSTGGSGESLSAVLQDNGAVTVGAAVTANEPLFFWGQLAQAGLLSGITYRGETLAAGAALTGYTNPPGRIPATAFIVGHYQGTGVATTVPPRSNQAIVPNTASMTTGPILLLVDTARIANNGVLPTPAAGTTVGVSPNVASQIDRKLDDGLPGLGAVQFFGTHVAAGGSATSCTVDATINGVATTIYQEAATTRECGVFVRIQS